MMKNILEGITSILQKNYPNSPCYFNPIQKIEGDSFILNLIGSSQIGEPNNIHFYSYEWDLSYIPLQLQELQNTNQLLFEEMDHLELLSRELQTILVKGFYNRETKQEDQEVLLNSYDRRSVLMGDIYHFLFTIEFRAQWVTQEEMDQDMITTMDLLILVEED